MTEAEKHAADYFYSKFPKSIGLLSGTVKPISEIMVSYSEKRVKYELQSLYDELCSLHSTDDITVAEVLKTLEKKLKRK